MKVNKNKGFTLIELMIVIAIIGVLATLALPMYQDYVVKAQVTRVFYEVNSTRSAIETIVGNGRMPTTEYSKDGQDDGKGNKYEYIGFGDDAGRSNLMRIVDIEFLTDDKKNLLVAAEFGKDAYAGLHGLQLIMTRTPTDWYCTIDNSAKTVTAWKDKYLPTGCKLGKKPKAP